MIQLQILNKILSTQDYSFIEENLLTDEFFTGYETEFNFIKDHYDKYGNIPDKATFLEQFQDFEFLDVTESDRYLIDKLREENLYTRSVPVVQKIAELLKSDANAAAEYMMSEMRNLQPNYDLGGINIITDAEERFEKYKDRKEHQDNYFFTSGFEELDDLIHGIQREEELMVILARTNQGKSWILEKMCTHVWEIGFNVGYISPEMSATSIGYRFDTLFKNYSNKGLMWGKEDVNEDEYKQYITTLQDKQNKFIVATPTDFDKRITVTKLKNWVKQYKLDMIAVDGITYMTDERARRGDNKTTSLTNISEDLMTLSMEMQIPVIVVVQANRGGVAIEDEGTPELEHIRDSDGIAHNASKVISMRQKKDNILEIGIKKQRNGTVGGKLNYNWDINTGTFTYIPSYNDAQPREVTHKKVEQVKKQYKDSEDVF